MKSFVCHHAFKPYQSQIQAPKAYKMIRKPVLCSAIINLFAILCICWV